MFYNQVQEKKHLNNNDQQNELCWSRMMQAKTFNPFSAGTYFRRQNLTFLRRQILTFMMITNNY